MSAIYAFSRWPCCLRIATVSCCLCISSFWISMYCSYLSISSYREIISWIRNGFVCLSKNSRVVSSSVERIETILCMSSGVRTTFLDEASIDVLLSLRAVLALLNVITFTGISSCKLWRFYADREDFRFLLPFWILRCW